MDENMVAVHIAEMEKEYRFYVEQRNNKTLVLNVDTGVWKIDEEYNELFDLKQTSNEIILSDTMKIYDILKKR